MSDRDLPIPFEDVSRTLTVQQRRVLYWRWVTGGENHEEAAEVAGVAARTIYRWLMRSDFRAWWDDPESWAKQEVRHQRAGLELKSLHTAHALLDSPTVADGVKADVLAKALTDVRQTKQLHLDAATTATWAAMLDQWEQRSEEILGAQKDGDGAIEGEVQREDS